MSSQVTRCLILFFLVVALAQAASAQKLASVAGNWDVTVKMPDHNTSEHWVIHQSGEKITGTVKRVNGDLPLTGTVDEVFLRAEIKDGDKLYKVRTTVDQDDMDGSITYSDKEYLLSAKRNRS